MVRIDERLDVYILFLINSACMGAASSTFAFGMEKEMKNFKI